jgi:hypothetical protein
VLVVVVVVVVVYIVSKQSRYRSNPLDIGPHNHTPFSCLLWLCIIVMSS